ncbi:MAG: hypothetical protein AAB668_04490 [Patescibacteria group bacterium]
MQKDTIQNIFIGVLLGGVILLAGGFYLVNQQLKLIATSIKSIDQVVTQLQNAPAPQPITVGEPNPSAPTAKTLVIGGLTFDLPEGWSSQGVNANGETLIRVPDPTYNVSIPVSVRLFDAKESKECLTNNQCDVLANTRSTVVYASGYFLPVPSLGAWIVKKNESLYQVTFAEPVSNQPAPKDLDGVWFPSTVVTDGELISFVLTAR